MFCTPCAASFFSYRVQRGLGLRLSRVGRSQSPQSRPCFPFLPNLPLLSFPAETNKPSHPAPAFLSCRTTCFPFLPKRTNHLTRAQLEPSSTRVLFMDLMLPGPYNEVQSPPPHAAVCCSFIKESNQFSYLFLTDMRLLSPPRRSHRPKVLELRHDGRQAHAPVS